MTNPNQSKSFILHKDSLSVLNKLTDEQAGKLFKAISGYHLNKKLPTDNLISIIFEPFLNQFKRDEEKYQNIIERNKINGSKGGRPKNPVGYLETQENPSEPKKADSNNKNKNDSKNKNKNDLIKKEKTIYDELADELKFILEDKLQRKVSSISWSDEIRKLIEIDLKPRQDPIEDTKRAIQAIADNFGKEYFPIVQSGKSLREKFSKLENFLARNQSTESEEEKCNLLAGKDLFAKIKQFEDRVEIICKDGRIQEAKELSEAKRQMIRNQFNGKKIILL